MSRPVRRWPLWLIASPAAVAIWSGWVGLGTLCGFGVVHPLPGIWDSARLNTAITLPIGVEAYAAYALGAWLSPGVTGAARAFARRSAIGALVLGCTGQVLWHLLSAGHATRAPWPVVMLVACLPVVTLAFGAALTHLLRADPARTGAAPPGLAAASEPARHPDGAQPAPAAHHGAPPRADQPARDQAPAAPARSPAPARRPTRTAPPLPAPGRAQTGQPARRRASETAASPAALASARRSYRASVAAGSPLSARALAERHGISRRQAANVIAEPAPLTLVRSEP